jgi:hypothetical protein
LRVFILPCHPTTILVDMSPLVTFQGKLEVDAARRAA